MQLLVTSVDSFFSRAIGLTRRIFRFACASAVLLISTAARAQLTVDFGPAGLQKLAYSATSLEDTKSFPADAFHIGHMKVTDLHGNLISSAGWGENSPNKQWDVVTHTWTYAFSWGTIRCQYVVAGDRLNIVVTESNRPHSDVVIDGASVYPLVLHFPVLPSGFGKTTYPQITSNTTEPSATLADFGTGEVAAVVADARKPLYSGFWPDGGDQPAYSVLVSSTSPDGLAVFQPHVDRPVSPGQVDTFTVSLRFAKSGTASKQLAADAFARWSEAWPSRLDWTDRRMIGTSYLASAASGRDITRRGGFANNPRRYFNVSDPDEFDIHSSAGMIRFQRRVLEHAADIVANLKRLNAQGVITWDIEGQEYPQSTSYVCAPDQIAAVSPEMDAVITDSSSIYKGMKLDDAYFHVLSSAGFRIGVCVRPQHLNLSVNGTAQQVSLDDKAAEAEMLRKIRYAHDRWGATLFYLDSVVEPNGMPLDPAIFQRLQAAMPDSLLIPEQSSPKDYAYTAPFKTFLFHRDLGTDAAIYAYYPRAFSCNLVNDVDPKVLAASASQLVASVAAGDVLMTTADYWAPNNSALVAMYQRAAALLKAPRRRDSARPR